MPPSDYKWSRLTWSRLARDSNIDYRDTIARLKILARDSSSRVEDRGERIEDRDTYTYPLLGRKLRLTERQKLENVQKSRTLDAVENKNAKKCRKEVV